MCIRDSPKPVLAVMLLFPVTDVQDEFREKEEEEITKNGQTITPNLFFLRQYARNACGTIGVVHALSNVYNVHKDAFQADGWIAKYVEENATKTPEERGKGLQKSKELETAHKKAVVEGDTSVDEDVNTHFICFVEKDGNLYELDGTKPFAINHGKTTQETLLNDACEVIKKFMARDPEEIRFTTLVLASAAAPAEQIGQEFIYVYERNTSMIIPKMEQIPLSNKKCKQPKFDFGRNELLLRIYNTCLLYTSPSPRDGLLSRMPSSA
eukprot:TRINITY_DN5820_c0_g1_i2.p1 TRINITY_DN5820_c0_g1~~TRINITY_DN5820_c0_g1_i2.p1  ORF type:complete len:267 (-),score=83.44 TRINITY_DN5820_c0_g1_i2:48-848(-)